MTLEKQIAEDYGMVLKEAQSMGCNKINALYNIPLDNMKAIVNALEEVQKYRAIGTPEEIKQKLEELERWHTYRLAINVKNPFAKMSTSICHNCDHKDEYIEELEAEIKEYKAIGDFAELVEKWCWKHQYHNQDDLNELMEIAEQLKGGGVNE